jgi:hypothetical protein
MNLSAQTLRKFGSLALAGGLFLISSAASAGELAWKKHTVNDQSEFEAAGAMDVDNDGDLDIVSGSYWYEAPSWKKHNVRDVIRQGTYYNCFSTLPVDANADGFMDFVTVSYFGRSFGWVENPKETGKKWTYHEVDLPGTSEAAWAVDLTGDGKLDFLPNPTNAVVWYELEAAGSTPKFKKHDFGTAAAGHGVGSGDINRDGRIDLLTPKGWFEAPEKPSDQEWKWHPDWNLGATGIQILARDMDGDGLTDLIWGNGHDIGLFWAKQVKDASGKVEWKKENVDMSIASVHTLLWADLDGDGEDEMITGKRVYAHEREPGDIDAPAIAAFNYDKASKAWKKRLIYLGEPARNAPKDPSKRLAIRDFPKGTAGTGLQLTAIDMDKDGDLDLVAPGKSGLYWFENLIKSK